MIVRLVVVGAMVLFAYAFITGTASTVEQSVRAEFRWMIP